MQHLDVTALLLFLDEQLLLLLFVLLPLPHLVVDMVSSLRHRRSDLIIQPVRLRRQIVESIRDFRGDSAAPSPVVRISLLCRLFQILPVVYHLFLNCDGAPKFLVFLIVERAQLGFLLLVCASLVEV